MEGGELGGMAGLRGLGSQIAAVPLAQIAGVGGRASPTISSTFWGAQVSGMGAAPLAPQQGYATTPMATSAPPIGITTYTPPGWTWGKIAVAGIVVTAVFYGAYRAASWWDGR